MATFRLSILGAAVWLFALGSAQGQVDLGFRTDGLVVEYVVTEMTMPQEGLVSEYFSDQRAGDHLVERIQGEEAVSLRVRGNIREVNSVNLRTDRTTRYCFGGASSRQELVGGARNDGRLPRGLTSPLSWFKAIQFPKDSYEVTPQIASGGRVVGYSFVGKPMMLGPTEYQGCAELDLSGLAEGGLVVAVNFFIHPLDKEKTCKIDETTVEGFTSKWGKEVGLFPSKFSYTRYSADCADRVLGRIVLEVVSVKVATEDILAFEDGAQAGLQCLSPNEIYSFENKRVEILNAPEGTPARGGLPTSKLPRILLLIGVGFLLIAGVAGWRGMKKKSARRR